MENVTDGLFKNVFARVDPGVCRLGVNGQVAIKTSNGFKTYNVKTGRLTNVNQLCFDMGQDMFFVVPTTKAKVGDILLIDGPEGKALPKCVIEVGKNTLKVMSYEDSTIQEIVPERHIFMGQAYFYRKITSFFGTKFLSGSKGMNKMFKLAAMKEMFGNGNQSGNNMFGGMLGMMAMGSLFGGNNKSDDDDFFGNIFNEMEFDGNFEFADEEEDEEEKLELTEEEKEAILKARAKKAAAKTTKKEE